MGEWRSIETAPEGVVIETKIDDHHGVRNVQELYRHARLWWTPDGAMYVYYQPTHWRFRPWTAPAQPVKGVEAVLEIVRKEILKARMEPTDLRSLQARIEQSVAALTREAPVAAEISAALSRDTEQSR